MSEELYVCKCGFKCIMGQLAKTDGYCPVCKEGRADMIEKHAKAQWSKRKVE